MFKFSPRKSMAALLIAVGSIGSVLVLSPAGVVFATESGGSGNNQVKGNVATLPNCGVALQGTSGDITLAYVSGGTGGKFDATSSNYTLSGTDSAITKIYSYSLTGAADAECTFWTSVSQKTASVSLSSTKNICYKAGSAIINALCSASQKTSGYADAWGFWDNTANNGRGLSFIVGSDSPLTVNDSNQTNSGITCTFSSTPSVYESYNSFSKTWSSNSGTIAQTSSSVSTTGNCNWKNQVSVQLPTASQISSQTGVSTSDLAGLSDTLYGPVITTTLS